jgi:hypothetical protein
VAQFDLSEEQRNGSSCESRIGGGHDWSPRLPTQLHSRVRAAGRFRLIDGEAVAPNDDGLPVFERLRYGAKISTCSCTLWTCSRIPTRSLMRFRKRSTDAGELNHARLVSALRTDCSPRIGMTHW